MKIIKYPWLIIAVFLFVTVLIGINIPKNTVDGDVSNYIPAAIDSKINTEQIEKLFGGTEILMLTFSTNDILNPSTLTRIKKLSQVLKKDENVEKVLSVFEMKDIHSEYDAMYVSPAVKRIPKTNEAKEKLREQLKENDLVYESIISKDFTKTAIVLILNKKPNDQALLQNIEKLLEKYPGQEDILIGGIPLIRAKLPVMISKDMQKLMPLAILIMLVMLFMSFRRWRGVFLPFLVVIAAIALCLGLVPLLGWQLSIVSVIIPVMLIAVANDYGIHIIARYQEINTFDNKDSSKEIVIKIIKDLWKPILITGITTVVGILGLLSHKIIPSRQMGIISAIGIAYALIASLLLIPAILSILKKEKPLYKNTEVKLHLMDRFLLKLGNFVASKPKQIVITSFLVILFFGIGLFFLGIDANPMGYFKKKDPIKIADNVLNENFGGTQQFIVLFEGDIKDPVLLKKMDYYATELKKIEGVGKVDCLSEVIKEMSKAMNNKEDAMYNKIPDTRNAVAQYLEMYMMSGDADDFEKIVDFDYQHAQMIIRIKDASTKSLKKIETRIKELSKGDKSIAKMGGYSLIIMELGNIMLKGQGSSMIFAAIAIFILISLLFKSTKAGILGIIPLFVSTLILFGLMGMIGMQINIASAMLSSILIGIGIDYTIHFLWRYQEELKESDKDYSQAIKKTLQTTGRGIIFNAVSVIVGFFVLMFSGFLPIVQFGYLIVFSVFTCLLGAIILVPAICQIWKPEFLEKK